jgi:muramoyltetrapeptide carboxypeptidase
VRLHKAAPLAAGCRIAVVSPTSPFRRDSFDRGVAELERLGFVPVYDESVHAREDGYLSGSAHLRASAFMRYWQDPDVSALIAVRGGYGSVELLPLLDRERLVASPKLFIGYSDNTSILSWLTTRCGVPALHGPMLDGRLALGADGYDVRSFTALLTALVPLALEPPDVDVVREGEAAGPLVGGTLTQIAASLGTPYAFAPPAGCILFLEDVNERPYRIDRLLTQIKLAGILDRAAGLVFGEMRGCDEPDGTVTARQVVRRLTRDTSGPVIFGFPSGHTTGPMWTLPLGVRVSLTTSGHPRIVVEESAVG